MLDSLSPMDGRYEKTAQKLSPFFSEAGLIRWRLVTMIEWVEFLSKENGIPIREFSTDESTNLSGLKKSLAEIRHAKIVKRIETTKWRGINRTNHDVKACEIYLREWFKKMGLADVIEWIHFGRTSEDVNNVAYARMLQNALDTVIIPALDDIVRGIQTFAERHASLPMLARTHGQPATPTTLGKEFLVFQVRLERQMLLLDEYKLFVKWNGATGTHAAEYEALPGVNWVTLSERFTKVIGEGKFSHNSITTQIEPHDTYAELFQVLMRINTILIGFVQDMWRYISDDWIVQKAVEGEVGSSAMPHKVNPINFENAEGNLGFANACLGFFCEKLPISRLQRDLSDSTVERCFGMVLGHCLLAYENIAKGMEKVSANERKILSVLHDHPEVLAEAYQTILRSVGYPEPYNALKAVSRGAKITLEDLHAFVASLEYPSVTPEVKERMLALTPETYIGCAPQLARMSV